MTAKVFAVGGYGPEGTTGKLEVYNPENNSWTEKAEMLTAREHLSSAVINGKLYAVGGYAKGFGNHDVNERYDPVTNTWESLKPLPSPRNGHTSPVLNDVMLVIGGENDFQTLSENEAYIPEEDAWYSLQPLPIQRQGLFSASLEDKIYLMGGGDFIRRKL